MNRTAHFYARTIFAVGIAIVLAANVCAADEYALDNAHSSIGFAVKHLMVSTTKGEFTDYAGTIQFDPENIEATAVDVTIQATSIDTRVVKRDDHLRSPDFFDVEKFPTVTFKSKSVTKSGEGFVMTGDLTIHGVTKETAIPCTISGPVQSPSGAMVIGITGETKINRQDFGLTWNKTLDQGGYVVDDEVNILVSVEAQKK